MESQEFTAILDIDGVIQDVNAPFTELLGRSSADLLGTRLVDLVHADDRKQILARLVHSPLSDDGWKTEEFRIQTGPMEWRWICGVIRSSSRPQWDGSFTFSGVDITDNRRIRVALAGQNQILEAVAAGAPLLDTLNAICAHVEVLLEDSQCSILLLDDEGQHLFHAASRGLPSTYIEAIEGLTIGPCAGSCGTAAFLKRTVVVPDIGIDPLWNGWREVAIQHELRACWSTPIRGVTSDDILGTFAVYYRTPRAPTDAERDLVVQTGHLASVAIKHHRAKESERQSEERFRALVQNASDITVLLTSEGSVRYASPALTTVLGILPETMLGDSRSMQIHPDDLERATGILAATIDVPAHISLREELRVRSKSGAWHWLELIITNMLDNPSVNAIVINARDVSDRKLAEQQLQHLAMTDPLTNLPNRTHFLDRLAVALKKVTACGPAILFLDLDHFKLVNDGYGHAIGDQLLVATGQRLRQCLQNGETLARWGGDEFTILLGQGSQPCERAVKTAERILAAFEKPFEIETRQLTITPSIGIAIAQPSVEVSHLIREADIALYESKSRGRSQYAIFNEEMGSRLLLAMALESEMSQALDNQEFVLEYEPLVDLTTGAIRRVEALVRWQHPQRGMLAPAAFIGIAERTGLIVPLGIWILRSACQHAARWQQQHPLGAPIVVSVNVSVTQIRDAGFAPQVLEILAESGLKPSQLMVEITESFEAKDEEILIATLTMLRTAGVRTFLDDFGTGFSGLRALQRLPLDGFKIAREFVAVMREDATAAAIIRAMMTTANELGYEVTAEGIETADNLSQVRDIGCTLGQGFLFSPTLSVDAMGEFLAVPTPFAAPPKVT